MKQFLYRVQYRLCAIALRIYHPFPTILGRENIPRDRNCLICANHRGIADPLWILSVLKLHDMPRILAKQELFHVPILGAYLRSLGILFVRRGQHDMNAIKACLKALNNGENLMIFPEGTRMRSSDRARAKTGAVIMSLRTGVPILPVYLEVKRHPFSKMRCVIGKPYLPALAEKTQTSEELHALTDELMDTIYALGARA